LADAALGIVIGVGVSMLVTRLVADYLFQVEPTNVITFTAAAGLLLVASLVAAWIPARPISRVDPHISLSSEP
jgi:ABC-type antimicrobial peptide transport system permease subunit